MQNIPQAQSITTDTVIIEEIKLIELIHIIANVLSGGMLGIVGVTAYIFIKKDIHPDVKNICYDIINFNMSFVLYFILGFLSLFVLVGFFVLPVIYIAWLILMIVGAIKHFSGERYTYPMIMQFIQ